jgi:hypothetical protein
MIVVRVELASGISRGRDRELGTVIIDNVGCSADGKVGDYRVRAYPKGAIDKHAGDPRCLVAMAKPHREGTVNGHRRLAEPVNNLVAKALASMGYGK